MQHIMIRISTADYDAWLRTHHQYAPERASYGIQDGPVYRDITDPNAALFHITVEDMGRAMQWFSSDTFKTATQQARVTGREFYLAERK
jgi:hypothetical protein